MKISEKFKNFANNQLEMAQNEKTLFLAFGLAAAALPFSDQAAIGAAIAPTLIGGSALISGSMAKVLAAFEPSDG
ncbi:MAG: hypothetical protein V2J51_07255 [Erythrobacter sp.]|jgi:hypothetical protein|nr:hypothetical protein [Erythrobacter sp.]